MSKELENLLDALNDYDLEGEITIGLLRSIVKQAIDKGECHHLFTPSKTNGNETSDCCAVCTKCGYKPKNGNIKS